MNQSFRDDLAQRILILTPFGRDGTLLSKVLSDQGFQCDIATDMDHLISCLKDGAGAVLLTEEVLTSVSSSNFLNYLKEQPSWSAIPVLTFYGKRTTSNGIEKKDHHPLQAYTEITFLERPVSTTTLTSATRAALRDRNRQYQVKGLLIKLESDIARLAQQEAELIASRELAQVANQSKTQFLANMSHEIRTPLGAIMGFAELMQESGQDPEEQKECLETIVRNGRQLANLVNDLLDISKVEAGRMEAEVLEFRLADVVLDVEKMFRPIASAKGVQLLVEFAKPFPERIFSDPTRLRQILINLIGNSLKFTSKGNVHLHIEAQPSLTKPLEIDIVFRVSDTGLGMTSEEQSKIFDSFVQGDASTTRKFGGTGLGLTLSRNLARLLGGSLYVGASEKSIGTTMVLEINGGRADGAGLIAAADKVTIDAESDRMALRGMDILVVEDSKDIQNLITRILENSGALVDLANDGQEGVEKASGHDYDAVLMDIQMPNKDGYSAARELRDHGYTRPLIALTAHAMREDREKSERAGFSAYLTKPIHRGQLIATLHSQCSRV